MNAIKAIKGSLRHAENWIGYLDGTKSITHLKTGMRINLITRTHVAPSEVFYILIVELDGYMQEHSLGEEEAAEIAALIQAVWHNASNQRQELFNSALNVIQSDMAEDSLMAINLSADQWELYTETAGVAEVAKTLNKQLREDIDFYKQEMEHGMPALDAGIQVKESMFVFMSNFASYGASDTEPQYILCDIISKHFDIDIHRL